MEQIPPSDDAVTSKPHHVFKPRNQWNTFWNDGDGPCRVLETISPGDSSIGSRKRPRIRRQRLVRRPQRSMPGTG